jgi:hypothetical protein
MNRQSLFFSSGFLAFLLAVGAPCSAQEATPSPPQAPVRGVPIDRSSTYTYQFDDDSMTAVGLGDVQKLRVLPRASQETVIRPRASFVVPLIRSIETVGDPYPPPIRVRLSRLSRP